MVERVRGPFEEATSKPSLDPAFMMLVFAAKTSRSEEIKPSVPPNDNPKVAPLATESPVHRFEFPA